MVLNDMNVPSKIHLLYTYVEIEIHKVLICFAKYSNFENFFPFYAFYADTREYSLYSSLGTLKGVCHEIFHL